MKLFFRTSTVLRIVFVSIVLNGMFLISVMGQTQHYWNQSFNEESSMLAGAVVGGGSGISAIYYNPANISDADYSKLSLNASLFSLESNYLHNALGNGVDLNSLRFLVQPRFISYIIKPKERRLYVELATMNKVSNYVSLSNSVEKKVDILKSLPGEERYLGNYRYEMDFSDYWIGIGASYKLSERWSMGASMFASIKTMYFREILSTRAHPLSDTIYDGEEQIPFYIASSNNHKYLHYNNYRLVFKLGLSFKEGQFGAGLNVTLPSINVFSDGKELNQELNMINIADPDGEGFLPDVLLVDNQVKDQITVNEKDPFSIAAGITYESLDLKHTFYLTAEWFAAIEAYKPIQASTKSSIGIDVYDSFNPESDWMSYASASRSIFNIAFAYRWRINDSWLLMGGLKTDLNSGLDSDLKGLENYNSYALSNYNRYHMSIGARFNLFRHELFAGLKYTHGQRKGQEQIVNFQDPVEFNTIENAPLQGVRQNNMKVMYHGLSLFLGATFNFGSGSEIIDQ